MNKKVLFGMGVIIGLGLLMFLAWVLPIPVRADGPASPLTTFLPPSDDQVNAVAKELYCPVCENIPLDVCPTQACAQWRELIRLKLQQGWSKERIKQYFADQYGDRVLAEPPQRGLHWLVYVLPPILFILGAFILYGVLKGLRRKQPQTEPAGTAGIEQIDPYVAQLEQELQKRKQAE
jgi:cytochrome c-type biogenesis protein CcmH